MSRVQLQMALPCIRANTARSSTDLKLSPRHTRTVQRAPSVSRLRPAFAATASPPGPSERASMEKQSAAAEYQFMMTHGCHMKAQVLKLSTGECKVHVVINNIKSKYPCMLHWCAISRLEELPQMHLQIQL